MRARTAHHTTRIYKAINGLNQRWIIQAVLYGTVLAAAAVALDWIEYRHMIRAFSTELYITAIAVMFAVLGIWVGRRLTPARKTSSGQATAAPTGDIVLSDRERAVLERLVAGDTNKEIARCLGISPNTVKTYLARLFSKLEVQRRTQAIGKARELNLVP